MVPEAEPETRSWERNMSFFNCYFASVDQKNVLFYKELILDT